MLLKSFLKFTLEPLAAEFCELSVLFGEVGDNVSDDDPLKLFCEV